MAYIGYAVIALGVIIAVLSSITPVGKRRSPSTREQQSKPREGT